MFHARVSGTAAHLIYIVDDVSRLRVGCVDSGIDVTSDSRSFPHRKLGLIDVCDRASRLGVGFAALLSYDNFLLKVPHQTAVWVQLTS